MAYGCMHFFPHSILYGSNGYPIILYHGFYSIPNRYENLMIDELSPDSMNYQDFWVETKSYKSKIESSSEHYEDKTIVALIDYSGRYVIYNKYSGEYLRSDIADSIITIYDFNKNTPNIQPFKKAITCVECINLQIVGENIYYGKKFFYLPGTDAYDFKIYVAPKYDLSKSRLLGEFMEPLLVSPDGKYILAKKDFHDQYTYIILNTETQMYDYILGREYYNYHFFYSPAKQQFAFDTKNSIIYIEFPSTFPFHAIGDKKDEHFTKEQDLIFWEKHKHQSLDGE